MGNPGLENKADIRAIGEYDRTVLDTAVLRGHHENVQVLLQYGMDVNQAGPDGTSPLNLAIQNNKYEQAHLLIQEGADINAVSPNGETPLAVAARSNNMAIARLFLIDYRDQLDVSGFTGERVFLNAVASGNLELVEMLFEGGIGVNSKTSSIGIATAATKGHNHVIEFLSRNGCDINGLDSKGISALATAVIKRNQDTVNTLLANGTDVQVKDRNGRNVLFPSAEKEDAALIRLLLDKGMDVTAKDNRGRTVFDVIAGKGNKTILTDLFEHNAQLGKDIIGQAFASAAEKGHFSLMKMLCAKRRRCQSKRFIEKNGAHDGLFIKSP